ncbi:unnamed protein product, partial [Mesorhabditis spiculigera]
MGCGLGYATLLWLSLFAIVVYGAEPRPDQHSYHQYADDHYHPTTTEATFVTSVWNTFFFIFGGISLIVAIYTPCICCFGIIFIIGRMIDDNSRPRVMPWLTPQPAPGQSPATTVTCPTPSPTTAISPAPLPKTV